MKKTYIVADTHFGHKNIIKYSNRPFKSVWEMDAEIIKRWNSVVEPNDDVYHLGDFAFASEGRIFEILNQLNGNIHLIWGNHDQTIEKSTALQGMFVWCKDYHVLRHSGEQFILFHYPIFEWNKMHRGAYQCFGHVHGSTKGRGGRSIDVGVDCHDYYPIPLERVVELLSNAEIFKHH
jgi:calcineurin-like phosphoesterase family protein